VRLSIFDPQRWGESFANLAAGWRSFWFTPADPLVLAVQRIAAGLVLIYVVAVSTPLLSSLFAPDALIDQDTANLFRLEAPVNLPREEWERPEESFPPPTAEEREKQTQGFLPPEKRPPILRPDREPKQNPETDPYWLRWGTGPQFVYDEGTLQFSPYFHLKDPRWMAFVHGCGLVVATLFTLGFCTRVTSVLAWVYALSLIHRAVFAAFGMDTMLAITLFYLMLSPAGARLSVDRLIQRFRRARYALAHPGTIVPMGVEPSIAANVGLRLFQVHFCLIYINSGISKLQGGAWWNGEAIWQTMSNYEFTPVRFDLYTQFLTFLAGSLPLWHLVLIAGDLFTIALEIGLPFLIWYPRWRPVMLIGSVMLHTGIAMTMGMTSFSLLMIIMVGAFLPPASVRRLLDRLTRGSRAYTLLVSIREGVGARLAALVKAVDLHGQVSVVDVSSRTAGDVDFPSSIDAPQLIGTNGQFWRGYAIVERLARSLRLLWPVGLLTWIPGVGVVGRVIAPEESRKPAETAGVGGR
jgi:Vitamin K-dependent gamma-carboxylase